MRGGGGGVWIMDFSNSGATEFPLCSDDFPPKIPFPSAVGRRERGVVGVGVGGGGEAKAFFASMCAVFLKIPE